ncbi:cyclin-like protein [Trichoderma chlorosporum]
MSLLANPLATPSQLYRRTSSSTLPRDLDEAVFVATQCLTQAAGRLLQLPQSVTAQANVLLARFWLAESPMAHEFSDVSAATIFLVSKLGPLPRSPRDVSNVYAYLSSANSALFPTDELPKDDPRAYYQTEADYYAFQQRMLGLEARILQSLSFDTHVSLPHALAITYLQTLDFLSQPRTTVSLRTIQYLNASLLSPQMLYITHQPNALATAAIYNAARDLGAKMPEHEWWEVFDVDREELGFLVVAMRSVEGWMQKLKDDFPSFGSKMLKRSMVDDELNKRGLHLGNGDDAARDEEAEVMRMMDSR